MKRLSILLLCFMLLAPTVFAEESDWASSWSVDSGDGRESTSINQSHSSSDCVEWLLDGALAGTFVREGDVFRLYDLNGEPVTSYEWSAETFEPFYFIPFSGYDENGLARVGDRMPSGDSLYGLIDRDGQVRLEPQMDEILDFCEARAPFCKDDRWGYLDLSGNIVVPAQYDAAEAFEDGLAIVGVEEDDSLRYGLIDLDGHAHLEPIYEALERTSEGIYRAVRDGHEYDFSLQNGLTDAAVTIGSTIDLSDYWPIVGAKVPVLDAPAALRLDENLPRLNGATALVPLYAAVAQAVYPSDVRYRETADVSGEVFQYTNTVGAYQGLIDGTCDLIFVAQPSDAQLQAAKDAGVELNLTPIGYEAFVFFVHADNPLSDISLSQIRGVYSGKITQWDELGCENLGEIIAYQRPANSGSQTALEKLMGDTPIMPAPQARMEDSWSMSDIVNVIEYRNLPNAIGYSFRFFLKEMMQSQVKLLSIDGVEPTEENIVRQRYPIIATVYAVSRKDDANPSLAALLEWLQGEQSMELVRKSGYTPAIQYEDGKIVEVLVP